MTHPISDTYLDVQTARASAALPAAGAWDAAPSELACPGFETVTLFFTYTRGAAGGAFGFKIELSPNFAGATWHQAALYDAGAVASGADSASNIQRESIVYGSTAAGAEGFAYGPFALNGVERIRVAAHETGVVGTPGTLGVEARFA